jgi:hypothetical protein
MEKEKAKEVFTEMDNILDEIVIKISSLEDFGTFFEQYKNLNSNSYTFEIQYGTKEKPAHISIANFYPYAIYNIPDNWTFVVKEGCHAKFDINRVKIKCEKNSHVSSKGGGCFIYVCGDNVEVDCFASNKVIYEYGRKGFIALYSSTFLLKDTIMPIDGLFVKAYGNSSLSCFRGGYFPSNSKIFLYDSSKMDILTFAGTAELYDFSQMIIHHNGADGKIHLYDWSLLDTRLLRYGITQPRIYYHSTQCRSLEFTPSPYTSDNEIRNFLDKYGLKYDVENDTAIVYKAVHKSPDGFYFSDRDRQFTYLIGKAVAINKQEYENTDRVNNCTYGIHASTISYATTFGKFWHDVAILELEVPYRKISVPYNTDGEIRVPSAKVIREVPPEEVTELLEKAKQYK